MAHKYPLLAAVILAVALSGCAKKPKVQTVAEQDRPLSEVIPPQPEPTAKQDSPVLEPEPVEPQPAHAYEPAEQPPARTHVVKPGETLYAIARQYYGDGRQWRKIYQANQQSIKDPDKIEVGLKLSIP